jgi:hypothetical protein
MSRAGGREDLRDGADARGGRKWFVALQVHDDRLVRPTGDARAFGEAIGAGRMVHRGHRDAHARAVERACDAFVVGRHPHLVRARVERAACDVQHQRLAADEAQGLARQARGREAGRNGDDETGPWRGLRAAAACRAGRSRTLPQLRAYRHA